MMQQFLLCLPRLPESLLVILFAVVMWSVSSMNPWAVIQIPGKEWITGALWIIGFALIIFAAVEFISAKTTANPLTPGLATSIVTIGVYRLGQPYVCRIFVDACGMGRIFNKCPVCFVVTAVCCVFKSISDYSGRKCSIS
ncbi:MAG: hypothetical protein IPP22_16465 [Nitrosomonas sp.]|nr:hypothetical protein [Nitrosomonas sp.]